MPTESIVAQRVLVRDMPDRRRIVATLRIHQLEGNAHPYFSATGEVFDPRGTWSGAARSRNGRESDMGGCVHGAILEAFPGAVAFVRMHLSDYPSGTPMHAEANARYFIQRGELRTAAGLLRVDDHRDLPRLEQSWGGPFEARMTAFVNDQRPRWAAEARAARELLEMMPDAIDLRGYDMYGEPIERRPLPAWLIGADPETVNV